MDNMLESLFDGEGKPNAPARDTSSAPAGNERASR